MHLIILCLLLRFSQNIFQVHGHIHDWTSTISGIVFPTGEIVKDKRNVPESVSTSRHEMKRLHTSRMSHFTAIDHRQQASVTAYNDMHDDFVSMSETTEETDIRAMSSDFVSTDIQTSPSHEDIKYLFPTTTGTVNTNLGSEPFSIENNTNGVLGISPCTIDCVEGQFMANCTGLSLEKLNSTWFPANLNIIHLDNNILKEIDNFTFSHLHELRILTISENKLHRINVNAFAGLKNLKTLNLEYNKLTLSEQSYPPGVFDPLINLQELYILNNALQKYRKSCYPDNFLEKINKLEHLTIDSSCDMLCFGEGFRNLTNLSRLKMSGTSTSIDEYSFVNVKHVRELVLYTFEALTNFSDTALESLKELQSLTLHTVRVGVATSLLALKPLRGKNMTSIYFNNIDFYRHDSYASFIKYDGVLNYQKTQYLLEICVENFSLLASNIYVLQEDSFVSHIWDRCLRTFDISSNPLVGTKSSLMHIFNFKNLEVLIYNHGNRHCYDRPPDVGSVNTQPSLKTISTIKSPLEIYDDDQQITENYDISNISKTHNGYINTNKIYSVPTPIKNKHFECNVRDSATSGFFWVLLSDSLKSVQFRGSFSRTRVNENIKFVNAKGMSFLDLSLNNLENFQGNISGLESLQTLILSGNDMSILSETFFDNFCHLENLYLSNCFLGANSMSIKSGRLFQNLVWLQRLDLSVNLLNSLAYGTFQYNTRLAEIHLSKNRFTNIPFDLKNTLNLQLLDLRQNSITSFGRTERDGLDELAKKPAGIIVLLDGNALSCDCNNLDFLYWLKTTHVQLDSGVNLTCTDSDGVTLNVSTFSDMEYLWRKCWGVFFLYFAISILLCMTICFLIVFFVSKHQIWVKSALIHFFTGYTIKCPADYEIDVYIGYSEADYTFPCFELSKFIETELKLNTYVYHRDMLVWDMASSIVEAVNNSWRVILVFGSTFLRNDQWSMLTCRTAIYSQTLENPSKIIVLVHTNLQNRLPPEVLAAVSDDNIIVVPKWEMTYDLREKLRIRLKQS